MKAAIEIENLNFKYSKDQDYVLKDINLTIKEKEFVLLMGPSGCGKSTLINMINGVVPHIIEGFREGSVRVKGKDVADEELRNLSQMVGTVFQNPETQFFTLSVLNEIAFGPENLCLPREEIDRRIKDVVKTVDIEDLIKKDIMSLSGGQKQRVATASVLAMRPSILILDEPTSQLDPQGAIEVLQTVKRLKEKLNATIILIEHRLEEVSKHVDRVLVMDDGRIIADGSAREVFSQVDMLEGIGIRPPQASELAVQLRQKNLISPREIPLTSDEATSMLKSLIDKQGRDNAPGLPLKSEGYIERTNNAPLVQIENLWHQYSDGTVALRGIDLLIHDGEFVGIIGQNGSGKSTLVSHLLGLLRPSYGRVLLMGKDVSQFSVPEMAKSVGFIFQDPDLMLFQTSVWSEIAFGPSNVGLPPEEIETRVRDSLKMMRLVGFEKRHPHALSRGQRHRVAIASILAMRPRILIADEPTTGQDYGATKHYLELLRKMNQEGATILVISHDMKTIAKYVDRVIVLRDGRVLFDGPTRAVFGKPDILETTDINPPQITQISLALKEYGFPTCLTVEELVSCVEKVVGS